VDAAQGADAGQQEIAALGSRGLISLGLSATGRIVVAASDDFDALLLTAATDTVNDTVIPVILLDPNQRDHRGAAQAFRSL